MNIFKKLTLGLLVVVGFFGAAVIAWAGTTIFISNQPTGQTGYNTLLNATTTTATSTNVNTGDGALKIAGAKNVTWFFTRSGGAAGPNLGVSKFLVEVSPDANNWYSYNTLTQNIATSTNEIGTVNNNPATSSVSVMGTTTVISKMRELGFPYARCIVRETADGVHTCSALVEF